jgi:hypothetical protein
MYLSQIRDTTHEANLRKRHNAIGLDVHQCKFSVHQVTGGDPASHTLVCQHVQAGYLVQIYTPK